MRSPNPIHRPTPTNPDNLVAPRVISTAGKVATGAGAALSDATTGNPGNTGNITVGMCPRMLWRSMNPALPPPEPLTCLARGPDCCVNSAAAHVRRVA